MSEFQTDFVLKFGWSDDTDESTAQNQSMTAFILWVTHFRRRSWWFGFTSPQVFTSPVETAVHPARASRPQPHDRDEVRKTLTADHRDHAPGARGAVHLLQGLEEEAAQPAGTESGGAWRWRQGGRRQRGRRCVDLRSSYVSCDGSPPTGFGGAVSGDAGPWAREWSQGPPTCVSQRRRCPFDASYGPPLLENLLDWIIPSFSSLSMDPSPFSLKQPPLA